jgi:hypothetical protein
MAYELVDFVGAVFKTVFDDNRGTYTARLPPGFGGGDKFSTLSEALARAAQLTGEGYKGVKPFKK